jgi:hypothetical protein
MITFYQSAPQKSPPALQILDSHGRVVRSVSGTHKVGGKDEPYIPNKTGLNRYTWDFAVNGPVKWSGAGPAFLQGPDTGPQVVPGNYSVRMTLAGHTYVQHFRVEPDPRSQFTHAQLQRSFDEAMRQMSHLSTMDTILNNLDALKKSIDAALDTAKKKNNTALVGKLNDAQTARKTLADSLATTVRGEGTEDETKVREDVQGAMFQAQPPITPMVVNFIARVDAEYRAAIGRYNAFATGTMPGIATALQQAGVKTVPSVKPVSSP